VILTFCESCEVKCHSRIPACRQAGIPKSSRDLVIKYLCLQFSKSSIPQFFKDSIIPSFHYSIIPFTPSPILSITQSLRHSISLSLYLSFTPFTPSPPLPFPLSLFHSFSLSHFHTFSPFHHVFHQIPQLRFLPLHKNACAENSSSCPDRKNCKQDNPYKTCYWLPYRNCHRCCQSQ
jgi:hypothetical protein